MIIQETIAICVLALAEMVASYGGHIPPSYHTRLEVCVEVAEGAEAKELPVALMVALSMEESAFTRDLTSKAGARGPLQIIPAYHCPNKSGKVEPHKRQGIAHNCNLIAAGLDAADWFWTQYDNDWRLALCHWNSGTKCVAAARAFSRRVMRRADRLEYQLTALLRRHAQ